jgi:2-pyrone-4,6-dicarboxylate lactonase
MPKPIRSDRPLSARWDCHLHVFGDPAIYPFRIARSYAPPAEANFQAARRMHEALGIERGVLVQPVAYATDYRALLDALKELDGYRGVVLIDEGTTDRELQRLHDAGVRGVRFNFWKRQNMAPTPAFFERSLARIDAMGWHAKIHAAGEEWVELGEILAKVKIPAVIDHMGHMDPAAGFDRLAFRVLLDLLKKENWWVMIANGDRLSAMDRAWDDVIPMARRLIEAAPDRAIWATDWPHNQYTKRIPNDAELLELLYRCAPEPELRQKLLTDNPVRLLGFADDR